MSLSVRPESLPGRSGGAFCAWERRVLALMSQHHGGGPSFPAAEISHRPSAGRLLERTLIAERLDRISACMAAGRSIIGAFMTVRRWSGEDLLRRADWMPVP